MKLLHTYQTLPAEFYLSVEPEPAAAPQLLLFNQALAQALGLGSLPPDEMLTAWFSGQSLPPTASPIAQAYAGHQFGHLNMLGDGRAVLLGEIETPNRQYVDIQLKGSGKTPFSRGGDGKAALAPMLREYLMSEAMFALGIATTRSLAVTATGETVRRQGAQIGAVLTRTASSHIRVGTFVYAAMMAQQQGDNTPLESLLHYTIARHYPAGQDNENPALALLQQVISAQVQLVVNWQRVGFIHGVLNTDNVAISGETIDYGPCAFMDNYDPQTVFSSIDNGGRYAFAEQASITQWNLARFAESLLPLIHSDEQTAILLVSDAINAFTETHRSAWQAMMHAKLGVRETTDAKLADDLLILMHAREMDYTNTFIQLTTLAMGSPYQLPTDTAFLAWQTRWQTALSQHSTEMMQRHNPVVIPRNHCVEAALAAATEGNLNPMKELLAVLNTPYNWERVDDLKAYQQPATAAWAERYQTFCGT